MSGIDSYTVSCLHFQNRVWTFAGTAQIDTAQSKFGAGSLLLNGSTDYISTPNSADFDMGDSDFTVDFWVRFGTVTECTFVDNGSGNYGLRIFIESNTLKATIYYDTGFAINFSGAWTPSTDTWYHIALVRNGATTTLYADGVVVASDFSVSMRTPNSAFVVGRNGPDNNGYVNGWIGEFRITKGLARWTADFSASLPTAKYADDANTVSLLHFDEADGSTYTKDTAANWTMDGQAQFYDETGKVWTASGNAQLDTAQKKFGSASGLFDGNGDYISASVSDDFKYDADFTVDCWIRPAAVDGIRTFYDCRTGAGSTSGFALFIESGYIKVYAGSRTIAGLTLIAVDTWYHVAIARSGTATKLFLGGTQEGSTWTTSANFSDGNAIVGQVVDKQHYFSGHIDELRISKGIARWTANFTPPTKEYSSVEVYDIPYLTDTDTPVAPSINHVFPPYLTDTDTPMAPSINHVFPPALTDTDTAMAPVFNYAFKMSVYATDTDTTVAPYFGQLVPLTNPAIDSDIPFAPILSGVPAARHRVKVNLV